MTDYIKSRVIESYNTAVAKVNSVYEIFKEYYTEDRVDLQDVVTIDSLMQYFESRKLSGVCSNSLNSFTATEWKDYRNTVVLDLPDEIFDKLIANINLSTILRVLTNKTPFILVWFPAVRVTNENDKFVDITHLYAKVSVEYNGSISGRFKLNRSEYTYEQFVSNYMHSHVPGIPKEDFTMFETPCTGSGPINSTICNLAREYDEDLWRLFCHELDKYTQVESIAGVPYNRLESIGGSSRTIISDHMYVRNFWRANLNRVHTSARRMLKEFITHLVDIKFFKYNYMNKSYSISMNTTDYLIAISNEFIDWYNKKFNDKEFIIKYNKLYDAFIIERVVLSNGRLYNTRYGDTMSDIQRYEGKKVCTFKGKDITLHIIMAKEENDNSITIIHPDLAMFIATQVLGIINYKYGREEDRQSDKNVKYI